MAADYTSNFLIVERLKHQDTQAVVDLLLHIFAQYGKPRMLVSDNGSGLNNAFIHDFARRAHIEFRYIAVNNPRANGKAERSVRLIKDVLKKLAHNMHNWDTQLFWAADIVNNTGLMYGYSPREIAFAQKATPTVYRDDLTAILRKTQIDGTFVDDIERMEQVQLAIINHRLLHHARKVVHESKVDVREALQKARLDTENERPYQKGEYVYRLRIKKNKLDPTFDGPFRIFERVGHHTYRLLDDSGHLKKHLFEASKLRPAYRANRFEKQW